MRIFKKHFALFLFVQLLICSSAFGEIKNGYAPEIDNVNESLRSLNNLLDDKSLTLIKRAEIKNKINLLLQHIVYFKLTSELLTQLRTIAPELYDEIEFLRGVNGETVDVYVRFVPEKEMRLGAAATTNIASVEDDKNKYLSEYGPNTVSVKIASMPKALVLLAHEFGHVKYQVTHLSSYLNYYAANYLNGDFDATFIGHNTTDPSGKMAVEFESVWRRCSQDYLRSNGKLDNPIVMLHKIQKARNKAVF
jgi:hypothetical protein